MTALPVYMNIVSWGIALCSTGVAIAILMGIDPLAGLSPRWRFAALYAIAFAGGTLSGVLGSACWRHVRGKRGTR